MAMQQTNEARYLELDRFIDSLSDHKGRLIEVLHKAQDIYGFVSQDVQSHIASKLDLPSSKVFGVVTFYSFLKTEPRGQHEVSICMGTACFVRGAEQVLDKFKEELHIDDGETTEDGLFSLDAIRCVGACGLAPVVRVGEKIYGRVTVDDVGKIIDEHLAKEV